MPSPTLATAVMQAIELRAQQQRALREQTFAKQAPSQQQQQSLSTTHTPQPSQDNISMASAAPDATAVSVHNTPQQSVINVQAATPLPSTEDQSQSTLDAWSAVPVSNTDDESKTRYKSLSSQPMHASDAAYHTNSTHSPEPHHASHTSLGLEHHSESGSVAGSERSLEMGLDWVVVDKLNAQPARFDLASSSQLREKSLSTHSLHSDTDASLHSVPVSTTPTKAAAATISSAATSQPKPGYIAIPPLPPRVCRLSVSQLDVTMLKSQLDGFAAFVKDEEPSPAPYPIQLDVRSPNRFFIIFLCVS